MRRKPCEGRNVNDSEADLYAEYHGNNGNQSTFSVGLDPSNNSDDQPRPRLRRISGRSETEQNVSQSKEIFENFPDLKNTIDYNFSKMYRYKNSDVNVIQSAKTESKENTVGEVNESTGKKGYDFQQQFGELYNEHSKFLEEKRIHDENKRQYLELSHESRASRSKSWSEGQYLKNTNDKIVSICSIKKRIN
jgi:hypothetical protein